MMPFPIFPLESPSSQAVKDSIQKGLPSIWSECYFQHSVWLLGTNQSRCQPTWSRISKSSWLLPERPKFSNPSETSEFTSVEISRPVIFHRVHPCFSSKFAEVSLVAALSAWLCAYFSLIRCSGSLLSPSSVL